jgi:glycosyltransferase involved in cell wall biosynthesis
VHSDDPQYWSVLNVIKVRRSGGRTICVTRYLADQIKLRRLDPDPIVIPCGVPVSNHRVHHSREPFHVVYSGRVVEMQKRMSLVLESLMRACQASPHIRATIIGDGTALQQCQDRVRAAGLMEAIRFTGRVSLEDVHNYLSEAQAILLMSDFEGLPVALMEAMAMGVVPVARAIPRSLSHIAPPPTSPQTASNLPRS